jgi:transcriptional regulator with XRE-family HTH domain
VESELPRKHDGDLASFEVANKMRVARLKRGLSQSQMAVLVDTSQPTYSRIESGLIAEPKDKEILQRIADFLKVPLNDLYARENLEELASQTKQTTSDAEDIYQRIRILKKLLDEGIVTQNEFNKKKEELVARL